MKMTVIPDVAVALGIVPKVMESKWDRKNQDHPDYKIMIGNNTYSPKDLRRLAFI